MFSEDDRSSPIDTGTAEDPTGEIMPATVVKLTNGEVVVDIGLKCEGVIPRSEFLNGDGQVTVAPGEVIQVLIEHYNEQEGTVALSYQKAAKRRAWEDIEKAFEAQRTVPGRVLERIKGGLSVDIGVPAFLPGSHVDVRPRYNLESLIGQEIPCKIIKLNHKRANAVVSRRLALEEEFAQRKARLVEQLQEGAVLTGRVKNLTDYGVFVDLGGMDGLLHITDLSWGRVGSPAEVVKVGEELRVKVLKFDAEKGRISLGLKQLAPDPWEGIAEKYHPGGRATGRIVGVVDYGAFVELEPGVEGLIHVSEMSWSKRMKHPSKIVSVGDRVEVAVLEVNAGRRRISLSLRQTLPDPWTTLAQRLAPGTLVEGRVRNLTEFGAFVEIEEGVDGLIHVSNISWAQDVRHPSEVLKKGQKVQAVVLGLDPEKRRISLGLRQLLRDPWTEFCARARVGDVVDGEVTRLASFGAFVEMEEGVEGLCHNSEMDEDQSGPQRLEVGSHHRFRVLRVNEAEKRIGLGMKGVEQEVSSSDVSLAAPPMSSPGAVTPEAPPAIAATEDADSGSVVETGTS
ncbi:MAG: 30S ribosomal protein S1 [Acidobacteriia bacterium]|nr:30S ribosomal protein S1 [Terriglobia bacterium]